MIFFLIFIHCRILQVNQFRLNIFMIYHVITCDFHTHFLFLHFIRYMFLYILIQFITYKSIYTKLYFIFIYSISLLTRKYKWNLNWFWMNLIFEINVLTFSLLYWQIGLNPTILIIRVKSLNIKVALQYVKVILLYNQYICNVWRYVCLKLVVLKFELCLQIK